MDRELDLIVRLGRDLHRLDPSSVVSKYAGETETTSTSSTGVRFGAATTSSCGFGVVAAKAANRDQQRVRLVARDRATRRQRT